VSGADDRTRRRVRVEGRVQGVGFRESCRHEAQRLGVAGSVRNLPDGSVEAVFEGPGAAVESMVAWCRHGPRPARVLRVGVTSEPVTDLAGFTIAC